MTFTYIKEQEVFRIIQICTETKKMIIHEQ